MDPLRRLSAAQRFAIARRLRRAPTPAERHAWSLLRSRQICGLKFRRQHVLHGFIVDFYCCSERLVLELEGDPHNDVIQAEYDRARAAFLTAAGYRVLRLRNHEVTREKLEALVRASLQTPLVVPPLPKGEGDRG